MFNDHDDLRVDFFPLSLYFQFKKPFKFVSQSINIGVISSRFVHHQCVWAQMSERDSMLCNLIADSKYTSTFIASYEIQLVCTRHVYVNRNVCENSKIFRMNCTLR